MLARQRIVTGFDAQGKSVIVADGPWSGQLTRGADDYRDDLWLITQLPAPLDVAETVAAGPMRVVPEGNGIALRIMMLPPSSTMAQLSETERAARLSRIDFTDVEHAADNPAMHRTPTLDVGIVLSGLVDLELDSGQVAHLQPGDTVIQRGTMHAWRVVGDQPCVMAYVMVRGEVGTAHHALVERATVKPK
jgi:hypothetical protein